jgi:probable HAF family extracellular repeat protein
MDAHSLGSPLSWIKISGWGAAVLAKFLVLGLQGISQPALAQNFYAVTDLGTLGGSYSYANDINDSGQVAGCSVTTNDEFLRAFRTAANAAINPATDDLGTLGGPHSCANAINNLGQVVGESTIVVNGASHAFRTAINSVINPATDDLGSLGGSVAYAIGINDLGQVVGYSSTSGNLALHAFRTAPNAVITASTDDLGTLNRPSSLARAINSIGQVVGDEPPTFAIPGGLVIPRAFRTAANAAINASTDNLGSLGGTGGYATDVNEFGAVVGASYLPSDLVYHAFRTAPNAAIDPLSDDLGTLGGTNSTAHGINDAGVAVGSSSLPGDGAMHAFVFTDAMYDLNTLIPAGSGWIVLTDATSVNNEGQIVGRGTVNTGDMHAFRLDPVSGILVEIVVEAPGTHSPSINSGSNKKISVAILSAAGFDASTEIDRGSLTFGRTGNEESLLSCNTHDPDLNADGIPDLTCSYRVSTADFQPGDTQGILKGWNLSGVPLRGMAPVLVRK